MKADKLKEIGSTEEKLNGTEFPMVIKAGGSIIRILYNPLVVALRSDSESGLEHLPQKTYPSFLVEYFEGSRLVRKRRNSLVKAKSVANEIKTRILNQDVESISLLLTGRERRLYLSAVEHLSGLDKEIDEVAREYAQAVQALAPLGLNLASVVQEAVDVKQKLQGVSLSSVVDFYERHGRKIVNSKKVPEIADELVAALQSDHRGDYSDCQKSFSDSADGSRFSRVVYEAPGRNAEPV